MFRHVLNVTPLLPRRPSPGLVLLMLPSAMHSTLHVTLRVLVLTLTFLVSFGIAPFHHGIITNFSKNCCSRSHFSCSVPRGGDTQTGGTKKKGLLRFFRIFSQEARSEQNLQSTLEEQIRILETSIRKAKEETRQLRSQLLLANSRKIRQIASDVHEVQNLKNLLEEEREKYRLDIDKLLLLIKDLEKTREELLKSLETERRLVAEQKELLEEERSKVSSTKQQAREQLESLKKTLVEESRKNIQALEVELKQQSQADIQTLKADWKKQLLVEDSQKATRYEQKLADERRKANEAMDKEKQRLKKEIQSLETEWKQKLKREESRKTKEFEEILAEERRKGEEAIENEKAKMRKLVKALAEREEREAEKSSLVQKTLGSSSSSSWAALKQINKGTSVRSVAGSKNR